MLPERRPGWILIETLISLGVLAILLSAFSLGIKAVAQANKLQWVKQQCLAAGQAQLESLATTDQAINEENINRLWPGVTVKVLRSAGQGDWSELELVRVEAAASLGKRQVKIDLARYIPKAKAR